jgi:tetratricopeptide (TPR) repeat protein
MVTRLLTAASRASGRPSVRRVDVDPAKLARALCSLAGSYERYVRVAGDWARTARLFLQEPRALHARSVVCPQADKPLTRALSRAAEGLAALPTAGSGAVASARLVASIAHRTRAASSDRQDRLGAPLGRLRLSFATALAATLVAGAVLLALPRDPTDAWAGLRLALQSPSVLAALSAAAVVTLVACIRAWAYRRLIRLPGPIVAHKVEDAHDPGGERPHLTALDTKFRQRLSELKLSAAAPSRGGELVSDFIELLETSTIDPTQPFAAIGRLLRLVSPTHAYEVKTTLLRREKALSYGVALEVVVLPQRRTTLRTYWHESWGEALARAATGVAAEVVPHSRHSDSGVWSSWKGLKLDDELFDLWRHAQMLDERGRYDEALERLYQAVRRDPGNGHLRFALAKLQERLALYLDALLTYGAIERATAEHSSTPELRIGVLAHVKYVTLLDFGERLADQWLPPPPNPEVLASRRSEELAALRQRLRPDLKSLFVSHAVAEEDLRRLRVHSALYPRLEDGLDELLDERPLLELQRAQGLQQLGREMAKREKRDSRLLRERRLHLFFQVLAEKELERLLRTHRRRELARLAPGPSITSIEMLPGWSAIRRDHARRLLDAEVERQERRAQDEPPRWTPVRSDGWPPAPAEIEALWRRRRFPRRTLKARIDASREFAVHYDAARTYAIGLLGDPGHDRRPNDARVGALIHAAIAELRKAANVGGSAALAARWHWILSEDADLAGLRGQEEFRRFESEFLPSQSAAPVRPRQIVRLTASRYSVLLCRQCAMSLQAVWHERARRKGEVDIHEVLRWWRDEQRSWELARELVHHHRHWQTRVKAIVEMQRFVARNGGRRFRVRHPRYIDQPIEGDAVTVNRAAGQEIHYRRRLG